MKPYEYAHRSGVRRLSWTRFARLGARLAELLEAYHPDIILGIARAGLFPAALVAGNLRRELLPIRLTRRVNDQVVYDRPVWKVGIPEEAAGKIVAVVDEISDTGQTLSIVAEQARIIGAQQVITASLVSHTWANPAPQVCSLITDEFVIFPWDQRVLENGKWIRHPEVVAGLKAQRHAHSG